MSAGTSVAEGLSLKERGQQLALDLAGDWQQRVTDEFRAWAAIQQARGLRTFVMEEFRAQARNHPHSHKAWGAWTTALRKAGLIAAHCDASGNQVYKRAASPRTHGHVVGVWTIV